MKPETNNTSTIRYYALNIDAVARKLQSDREVGLTSDEARERLLRYGPNELKEQKGQGPLGIFIDQFKDLIIWILIGAAVVSGFLKEWVDSLAIIAIILLNAVLGFVQEYRAEKSLQALKKLSSPTAKVIRGGSRQNVLASSLVLGDLIEIEAGDNVPCDCRVTYATSNFSTQEASLTGESMPVLKTTMALSEKEAPLAERANMVYMGTSVASGKARALVTSTGMNTELGKIATMIQKIEPQSTPLQKKLEQFGKWIVYVVFAMILMVFLLELFRGGDLLSVFLTAVSLAVAAIPEGLPAVVTISLALGVQRMVKRHALIRKLPSVETLGSTTVICSDKTGTLTKNEMTVQAAFSGGKRFNFSGIGYEPLGEIFLDGSNVNIAHHPELKQCLLAGALCNGAELVRGEGGYTIVGDPTEGAILTSAAKVGIWKKDLEKEYVFIDEIPFDSERKKMTIIRKREGKLFAFVKGAPEVVLGDCTFVEADGISKKLDASAREAIISSNNDFSRAAMRVLAVAYKVMEEGEVKFEASIVEHDLVFLGLVAMIDPPREEVKLAIKQCKGAGIKTVMITGDHRNTAEAIARELDFFERDSLVLTGEDLDKLDDEQFEQKVERIAVYARVSPEHKLRIVRAWRKRGQIVAMTGDGVNDAPAVKEADIGVAMGLTGTDVTKEVSDMVVTDDNFASIVAAVEEGRGIYDNIKKFIHYLLSCNAGEILVMFISSLVGLPIPLLPIQILWVNLVTDGLPALALGVDPPSRNIMKSPPRPPEGKIISVRRVALMFGQGMMIALCSLLAFCFVLFWEGEGLPRARTAAFIVLSVAQLVHSLNCRSTTESLFKIGIFSNLNLIYAVLVSLTLQVSVVYLPVFRAVFKTEQLYPLDWVFIIMVSLLPLFAMEILKLINRKGGFLKND